MNSYLSKLLMVMVFCYRNRSPNKDTPTQSSNQITKVNWGHPE